MGHGQGKTAKSAQEEDQNASISVDPPTSEPEPIFGSPIDKTHAFPAVSEEEAEDVPERRISIGVPIKTPSPEPVPRSPEKAKKVPFVFRWNYGGNDVYLAGEFNNWEKSIPLSKSHGDFTGEVTKLLLVSTFEEMLQCLHVYVFLNSDLMWLCWLCVIRFSKFL